MTHLPIKHWPAAERPRERLLSLGAEPLSDTELLAVLLGRGVAGQSVLDLARALLCQFGGIRGVLNASGIELCNVYGMGSSKAAALLAARECASRYLQVRLVSGTSIRSPADSHEFLVARLRDRPYEVFCCIYVDNRHRVLSFDELFRGTIDNTTVHPREVVRLALQRNAAAVILAHNHPSGVAEPSDADQIITRRLREALELVDVRVLDHLIIGEGTCTSMASLGLV